MSRSSDTASLTCGLRKKEVMNFALPSGSSPPEKPPGIIIICAFAIALANAATDSSICALVRFLMTKISASAPAFSNARAVSYSQFVPGNTGISTRGFANFFGLRTRFFLDRIGTRIVGRPTACGAGFTFLLRYGKTGSSTLSYASCNARMSTTVFSERIKRYLEIVDPITRSPERSAWLSSSKIKPP